MQRKAEDEALVEATEQVEQDMKDKEELRQK